MAATFIPSTQPVIKPFQQVIGEELSADFAKHPEGYSVQIDPASDTIATHSADGILLKLDPAAVPKSEATTFAYDAVSKLLSIKVDDQATALTVNLGALDDEGTKLVINGQNLELQNAAGTVLSTTPIGQIDAQQLSGAAAAAGYILTLSNGGQVTITAPEIGMMFPAGTPTATTELLTKDGKAVKVSDLPIADNWRTITGGLLPDGTADTTEAIVHGGNVRVGAGTNTAASIPLQVIASGTSSLTTTFGPTAAFSGNTSKTYYESTTGLTGERVMLFETQADGYSAFSALNDAGTAFVKQNIIRMDHSNGDLMFSGYPNTRNDPGHPKNVLTTGPLGQVESHPLSELGPLPYAYKNPNPSVGPVATPTTLEQLSPPAFTVATSTANIPNGTVTFRSTDGSHARNIVLPPVDATSVPIVIEGEAFSPVYVIPTNTDHNESIFLPKGTVARYYPGSDGLWHWIEPEFNPAAAASWTCAQTIACLTPGSVPASAIATAAPSAPVTGSQVFGPGGKVFNLKQDVSSTGILLDTWSVVAP